MHYDTRCASAYVYEHNRLLFQDDNWNWDMALMFGAMMSATDPVAVVALLKELGVSERLGSP